MRGVKGCLVSGQSHRANDLHTREEGTAAINTLKARLSSALTTVSDMAFVVYLCTQGDDVPNHDEEIVEE